MTAESGCGSLLLEAVQSSLPIDSEQVDKLKVAFTGQVCVFAGQSVLRDASV